MAQDGTGSDVLAGLDKGHPRLMLKDAGLQRLKKQFETDLALQKIVGDVLAEADACLLKPPLEYSKMGERWECLQRTCALGLPWRWTGDEKYARCAKENLLTVCAFPDWQPPFSLHTAELANAFGIGYDWLYGYLTDGERETIRQNLVRNALESALDSSKRFNGHRGPNNWNQVCNGGLIVAALAVADTDPEIAAEIVRGAVSGLPVALNLYEPDGAWEEGPAYWYYGTTYAAYALSALQTALGHDFGLSEFHGFSQAGYFPIQTAGPTGLALNFADSGERSNRWPNPCLFWLAGMYNQPLVAEAERLVLEKAKAWPQHLMWYPGPLTAVDGELPLDKHFRGPVEVAVFRSAWNDPEALWVGVKAGFSRASHGHHDIGNFEMDALGVRWARDLGLDSYGLPHYFGHKRWTYYRLNAASHNVPILDGKDQEPNARSEFMSFVSGKDRSFVKIDMTAAYAESALKVHRGVAMVDGRRAVLIEDEFELKKPCDILWGMTTDAEIEVKPDGSAELTLEGKRLVARLLAPGDATFVVESAEQKPPENPNTGVRRLVVRLRRDGAVRIAVLLAPVWKDGGAATEAEARPLAEW